MEARADSRGWWARAVDRGERLAIAASKRPYRTIGLLLAVDAVLAVIFVFAGDVLFDDPSEFFRELMPGTLLSFAQLLFLAVTAWAIQRQVWGERRIRLDNFWGLSALIFGLFAFDEITQFTVFVSEGLESLGAAGPEGFTNLDAFILSLLFLIAAIALLRRLPALFQFPDAVALLAVGGLLGIASQTLDSVIETTHTEFVAEESLKLAAEVFLIGGYLVVLHHLRGEPYPTGSSPQEPV
jgi:hypothetical protein